MKELNVSLVLSGGGSRGAYSAAIAYTLYPFVDNFNIVIGTSTGSLIAAAVAQNSMDDLRFLYDGGLKTKDVLGVDIPFLGHNPALNFIINALTGGDEVYDVEPLKRLIDRYIDFKKIKQSKFPVYFNVVNTNKYCSELIGNDGITSPQKLRQALIASCSIPVLMPLIRIDGYKYTDGGVFSDTSIENVDSEILKDSTVITIANSPFPPKPRYCEIKDRWIVENLFDTLGLLVEAISFKSTQYAKYLTEEIYGGHFIAPEKQYIPESLVFDPQEMRKMFAQGRADGKKLLAKLL